MDLSEILEEIEQTYEDIPEREPMRCGERESEWK